MGAIKMKNKKWLLGFLIITSFAALSYVIADKTIIKTVNLGHGIMKKYDNYEDRIEGSDLVVIAQLVGQPENILTPFDEFPDGYHLSKIKILEVIKGKKELENKEIEIREPYFTIDNGVEPGTTEIYYNDYTKLQSDAKYILCLAWVEPWNQYGISSSEQGKFNLDNKDQAEEKVLLKNTDFKSLKNDVINKIKK